jgi:hypothetical protein
MNARFLNSLMLIICPVLMLLVWMILEPVLLGEIDSNLEGREAALAWLQLNSGEKTLVYLLNIPGTFFLVGTFLGIAFLGRSLQGSGAAFGSLSASIFTVLIAIPVIALGLGTASMDLFDKGFIETAVTMDMITDGVFSGMPVFWALGLALLGIGLVMEKGFLPIWISWLFLVIGLVGIPGVLILGEAGFIIFMISLVGTVASGVVLFMRRAQE